MSPDHSKLFFSVIILTYERPKALRACLEAVARQDFSKEMFEVIVVDDGSKFKNEKIVDLFRDSLSIKFVYQSHQGISAARNNGIRNARGKFIAFVDDDYIVPLTYLQQAAHFFNSNSDAGVATFNIRSHGRGLGAITQRLYIKLAIWQNIKSDYQDAEIIPTKVLPVCRGAMFRQDVFSRVGFFNECLRGGEDTELTLRLSRADIPSYFLPKIFIQHWENKSFFGFLRQRYQYGANTFDAQKESQNHEKSSNAMKRASFAKLYFNLLPRFVLVTYRSLWVTARRLHELIPFFCLTLSLLMFIFSFWLGFFNRSRES